MTRHTIFALSSLVLLTACGQGRSDEAAAPAPDAVAPAAEAILEKAAPAAEAAVEIPPLPEVVAKINDDVEIKGAELQKVIDPQLARFRAMGGGAAQLAEVTSHVREDALERLVTRTILEREAAAQGFAVKEEEIDEFIAKNLPPNTTLEDIAKQQGITVDDLKADLRSGLTINKLLEKQVEALPELTDEELKAEYDKIAAEQPKAFERDESVEASHILVKVDKDADEAAKAAAKEKIEGIRKQLLEGADFAELAKEHSDCPSGKRAGGSLGTFGRGQMVKPFEEAAFSQPLDEIGPVVETDFGFHVIKVTKKTEAGVQTFEDVKDDLRKYRDGNRKNEVVQKFVEELRGKAKVETFLPVIEIPEEPVPEMPRELPQWAQ